MPMIFTKYMIYMSILMLFKQIVVAFKIILIFLDSSLIFMEDFNLNIANIAILIVYHIILETS